jgi:hypothetical protein
MRQNYSLSSKNIKYNNFSRILFFNKKQKKRFYVLQIPFTILNKNKPITPLLILIESQNCNYFYLHIKLDKGQNKTTNIKYFLSMNTITTTTKKRGRVNYGLQNDYVVVEI